jgi:hypothetical protein
MLPTMPALPAADSADTLEAVVATVEARLAALARALHGHDSRGVDTAASELQRALAAALDAFNTAGRRGPVPPALRQRLVRASGAVASQRETLARATAALDRAIDILLPREAAGYTERGTVAVPVRLGSARA